MKRQTDKGFTLIELLIVIVILGVLATVVVFAVGGVTDKSKLEACRAERRTVETAIDAYSVTVGSAPPSLAALVTANLLKSPPTQVTYSGGTLAPAADAPTGCDQ